MVLQSVCIKCGNFLIKVSFLLLTARPYQIGHAWHMCMRNVGHLHVNDQRRECFLQNTCIVIDNSFVMYNKIAFFQFGWTTIDGVCSEIMFEGAPLKCIQTEWMKKYCLGVIYYQGIIVSYKSYIIYDCLPKLRLCCQVIG